jgi:MFS family permease
MAYMQAVRLIQRDAWKLMSVSVVVGFGYFGIYAVIFNLYLLRLGYSPGFVGTLNSVALLVSALCAIPAGMVGRKWGVRAGLRGGYLIWLVASLLLPLSEVMPEELRAAWLFVAFSMKWSGATLFGVNRAPYLVGLTSVEERTHVFSIANATNRAFAVLGSLVAGFLPNLFAGWLNLSLESPAPYFYTLCIPPVLYLLGLPFVWSIKAVRVAQRQENQTATSAPAGLFVAMAAFLLLIVAAEAAANTFFNVYLDGSLFVSTSIIGALLAVAQFVGIPAALVGPVLVKRWGSFRVILVGAFVTVASTLLLASASNVVVAGLGYVGIAALVGILMPVKSIFHQEATAPEWRSTMSGIASMSETVGRALMVSAGGFLIAGVGYQRMFFVAALVTFVGAMFFWVYFRVPSGQPAKVPSVS